MSTLGSEAGVKGVPGPLAPPLEDLLLMLVIVLRAGVMRGDLKEEAEWTLALECAVSMGADAVVVLADLSLREKRPILQSCAALT